MAPTRTYPLNADIFKNSKFLSLNGGQQKYALNQWNRARMNAGLPRVHPPISFFTDRGGSDDTTHRPYGGGPSDAISYQEFLDSIGGGSSSSTSTTTKKPSLQDMIKNDPDLGAAIEHINNNPDFYSIADSNKRQKTGKEKGEKRKASEEADTPRPPPSTTEYSVSSTTEANMSADNRPVGGGPVRTRPRAGANATGEGGGSSGSDGGFDSAQGPLHVIERPFYSSSRGSMHFQKVHHMKTFAIPFWKVIDSTNLWVSTPLAEIPWQYMYFYMSEEEFNLIPTGSHVVSCKIKIDVISASTGHPYGGAEAGLATLQHPKIGMIGFDLEAKSRGGTTKKLTLNDNLETVSVADKDTINFIKYQYGSAKQSDTNGLWDNQEIPGVAFPIPFNTFNYFCVNQPSEAGALGRGMNDPTNAPGFEFFSGQITQFNINDKMWDCIFEREYKFTHAPVNGTFQFLEITTNNVKLATGKTDEYNLGREMSTLGANATTNSLNTTVVLPSSRPNVHEVTYDAGPIEQGGLNCIGSSVTKPARQPSVHIGMKAIPKLSAEMNVNRASQFVFSDFYFTVTAELFVETNRYPNKYTRPGRFNIALENTVTGIDAGHYPLNDNLVTFGLNNLVQ